MLTQAAYNMAIMGRSFIALAALFATACGTGGSGQGPETFADTIGVNTHYGGGRAPVDRDSLQRLADAGVRFIRNDLEWAAVETEPGVYDFAGAGFDALVETAEDTGLHILFILDYGNPLYSEANAVVDAEARQAFAAFAAAAAERYGRRGHSWEIWNEPNLKQFWSTLEAGPDPELYAALVQATAPALRSADPNGRIAVGALFFGLAEVIEATGLGIGGPAFLQSLADSGALGLADEVTLHFYRPSPPEDVAADVQSARAILDGAGYPLPVSSGEWGYSTYDADAPPAGFNFLPPVSLDRQASYLARMLLFNHGLGLARSVIFEDRDAANANPGNIEDHWGLMTDDLTPKPSWFAIATLTTQVGDAVLVETLELGVAKHALRFERRDGLQVIALWAEQDVTWSLRGEGSVLSRDGAPLTPSTLAEGAQLTVSSDAGPIYLLGDVAVLGSDPPS